MGDPVNRIVLPAATVERLTAQVSLDKGKTDPRIYAVHYALTDFDVATPASWTAATWQSTGPPYVAQALVTGTVGAFKFWVRVTTPDEAAIRAVGIVEFV